MKDLFVRLLASSDVKCRRIKLASEINVEETCHFCDKKSVHFGEVREYGVEIHGLSKFISYGRNIYCRKCRDEIGYELRDGAVQKP